MFIEQFGNYLKYEKRYSEHTIGAYLKDLEQFEKFLSAKELNFSSVKYSDVREWIVDLMDDSEARTINRKLSALRSFYKFLNREKLTEVNPVSLVKALKIPKRLPDVVPVAGINALLDSDDVFSNDFTGLRNRLVIELLFGTGIRLAELISMKDSDVNIYEQSIRITGKRNKERIVPVSATLTQLIVRYINEKKEVGQRDISPVLILTEEGKPAYPKLVYRIVKKYLSYITTAGKRSPHVLRHSFATSLLNNGADLNAIKELLGHASLAATQVYTHNSVERLKMIYKQAHPKA